MVFLAQVYINVRFKNNLYVFMHDALNYTYTFAKSVRGCVCVCVWGGGGVRATRKPLYGCAPVMHSRSLLCMMSPHVL